MRPTLVLGHRNPDADSICAAVAYAHLKNVTDVDHVYVPGRLGPMPPETAWAFDRFGVGPPDLVDHVRLRARDVMTTDVVTVSPDDLVLEAGRTLQEEGIRSLPVVRDRVVVGMITLRLLARRYVEDIRVRDFSDRSVTVGRLARALDGRVIEGDELARLTGNVLIGAMEPDSMLEYVNAGDTLLVGDRRRTQPLALEAGVACLVVTGGFEPEDAVVRLARSKNASIVVTPHDTYGAARLIDLSDAIGEVMEKDVLRVSPDALLAEVAEDIFASSHREAVVEDGDGRLAGLITRTDIAVAQPRRVVLVDHNEAAQSVPGIEEASVVEIVDHHRVGDVQTAGPILFLNMPVGSTSTIVAERYTELGIDIPESMAGILLSALLSDTLVLKSPTTTEKDREVAERLSAIVGVDATAFGMELFRQRSSRSGLSIENAVGADLKEYRLGEATVAIGQVETVESEEVLAHRDALFVRMEDVKSARGFDLVLLMVTDVVREGTELLGVGRLRLVERAFGVEMVGGSVWLPGVLSRKKQVAAVLAKSVGG